jgi:hypothetical protein
MRKLCIMLISMLIGAATTMAQIQPIIDAPAPMPDDPKFGPAYNGIQYTPRGHLHVLHVFVQFSTDNNRTLPGSDIWRLDSIPIWADQLYYSDLDEFNDTATDLSVSNYYYQNSKLGDTAFYVTGEYLDEPIIIPPIKNPDVDAGKDVHFLNHYDYLVVDSIVSKYPNKDWSVFDNRTEKTGWFTTNNMNTPSDSAVDLVVFHYRWFEDSTWCVNTNVTILGGVGGVASVYTEIKSQNIVKKLISPFGSWSLPQGFVVNRFELLKVRTNFIHELHHKIIGGPHYGGANNVIGPRIHLTFIWSMFKTALQIMDIANAWERYMFKWFEFKPGYDVNKENHSSDPYILDDYATTNDALRIKIPNSDSEIWLENHQNISFLDERKINKRYKQITIPQSPTGLYGYIALKFRQRRFLSTPH